MSEPTGTDLATIMGTLALIASFAFVWGPLWDIHTKFTKRYLLPAHVLLAITGWLWIPWICYGVRSTYAWNTGKINDLEFPTQVLPPTPVVRPSAADGVEK